MFIRYYDTLPEESIAIRRTVFMEEQGFQDEFDTLDDRARHLLLFIGQEAVGTCRFYASDTTIIIGRVAVLKAHRGHGAGSALIRAVENIVHQEGYTTTALHAQLQAQPFYETLGYTAYGAIEPEEGCPHIWMRKIWEGNVK